MSESESESENDCPICMETLNSNLKELACQHVFHESCIDRWLESHNTCPVCRTELFDVGLVDHQNYYFSIGRIRLCPVIQNRRHRSVRLLVYTLLLLFELWIGYNTITQMKIYEWWVWVLLGILSIMFLWDFYLFLCLLFNCRLNNCCCRRVEMDDFRFMEIV
jgi:hypothetical protein